jgi:hypothetical protein
LRGLDLGDEIHAQLAAGELLELTREQAQALMVALSLAVIEHRAGDAQARGGAARRIEAALASEQAAEAGTDAA